MNKENRVQQRNGSEVNSKWREKEGNMSATKFKSRPQVSHRSMHRNRRKKAMQIKIQICWILLRRLSASVAITVTHV